VQGQSLDGIRGTARLEDGALRSFGRSEPVDLNAFPGGSARWRKFGAIEITRGCIYACKFCQTPFMNRAKFRHRSVAGVCETVRQMKAIGMRDVRFISPTSLSYGSPDESVDLAAVEDLLARVRETAGASMRLYFGTFPSEVRPEHVTPDALKLLRRYVDNDNLIIGGQSGSESVLAKSHRGHDVESILRAARVAAECGFVPNVDFILGLPGEAEEEIAQTVMLMRELARLGARVHSHTFMPLPGTPFKDAPPGRVSAETDAALQALAGEGAAYGQWRRQMSIAEAISRRRRP
jgi:B12-binding domain/radical SAM domain protein